MIVTKQKSHKDIQAITKRYRAIFLVGCGECATTCKTGGKEQLEEMRIRLEREGIKVVGTCLPDAPCVAAQVKKEFALHAKELREADCLLVLACGLGVQAVKDNDRIGLVVLPACDTLCGATVDSKGNLYEKCSLCGECVLADTGGICPVTLCPKGLLNGPCGGVDKGKCEADPDKDCAWVLIYQELEKRNNLQAIKKIQPAKDFKKAAKPHKLILK